MPSNHKPGCDEQMELLVDRVKNGDREAFVRIVAAYQQKVFVLAYSLLRDREDALDLVQEVFMRVYEKIGSYRSGENFQAWLMRIARNLSIDFLRRRKKSDSLSDINLDRAELAAEISDPISYQTNVLIHKALMSIPEKQRLVFILHHFEGLKYEEIARRLGIAGGTVKSLHFKAVQKLKKSLEPALGGGK